MTNAPRKAQFQTIPTEGAAHPVVRRGSTNRDALILTDLANAERFAEQHAAHLRHCAPLGGWRVFDGRRWLIDQMSDVLKRASETARSWWDQVEHADEKDMMIKHARYSEKARSIENMMKLAQPKLAAAPSHFDSDIWDL